MRDDLDIPVVVLKKRNDRLQGMFCLLQAVMDDVHRLGKIVGDLLPQGGDPHHTVRFRPAIIAVEDNFILHIVLFCLMGNTN
jgi:hypothetical protein